MQNALSLVHNLFDIQLLENCILYKYRLLVTAKRDSRRGKEDHYCYAVVAVQSILVVLMETAGFHQSPEVLHEPKFSGLLLDLG
jgi:hypothetical protein